MQGMTRSKWICALSLILSLSVLTACVTDSDTAQSENPDGLHAEKHSSPQLREESPSESVPNGCSLIYSADLGKDLLLCPEKTPPPPP